MSVQNYYFSFVLLGMLCIPVGSASAQENTTEIKGVLSNIENYAENMVDFALVEDGKALKETNIKIQQNISILHHKLNAQAFDERQSRELMMIYSWTRIISIDIRQRAWIGVAIAANQLSASMIRFTNYAHLIDRDLEWMDYLGRELLLLNMEDPKENNELLRVRHTDLKNTWQRVSKTLMLNFRNKSLVLEGDHLILELEKTNKMGQTISLAKKLLVFVNKAEHL